jgi:xylan 1,4-beta-xylosidase
MKWIIVRLLFLVAAPNLCAQEYRTPLDMSVDVSAPAGEIDLTKYSLGQGGMSAHSMIEAHIPQLRILHPRTIRFFIQEFYHLYPAHGKYNWKTLDKTLDDMVATGARPMPNISFKPPLLFPKVDETIVHPSSYAEWEKLVYQLVKHCQEKGYGIEYWEITNEGDIGEGGGCPYLFTPKDYNIFYKHTADAIRRADPKAKVGGPALADPHSIIGDSLMEYCADGNAPLDFFSYHTYNSDPAVFRSLVKYVNDKLKKYPQLQRTETMLTEWNMDVFNPNPNPWFQSAFILEATKIFQEEGLSSSAYYEIRDYYIDPAEFAFLSKKHLGLFMDLFNTMPCLGLFDNQGRVRPSYFVFLALSQQKGSKLEVKGTNADIKSFTTKSEDAVNSIFWNFPASGKTNKYECSITYNGLNKGGYNIMRINPESTLHELETVRAGSVGELKNNTVKITLDPYEIKWIKFSDW